MWLSTSIASVATAKQCFPNETAAKLQELTDGCPRLINQVCDFGLILAGTRGLTTVSDSLIEEAWNDVQSLPMGSGSVVTESASSPTTATENNDWTLIEFGQLEDDSPQPQDATVYDFGNQDTDESIVGYSPEEVEVNPEEQSLEFNQLEPELEPETPSVKANIDTDLGIDLGSLQAMKDAASAKQAVAVSEDADSQEDSVDTRYIG